MLLKSFPALKPHPVAVDFNKTGIGKQGLYTFPGVRPGQRDIVKLRQIPQIIIAFRIARGQCQRQISQMGAAAKDRQFCYAFKILIISILCKLSVYTQLAKIRQLPLKVQILYLCIRRIKLHIQYL